MADELNKGLENNSGAVVNENNSETVDNTPKTYTQEEVMKLLQEEGDRRVSQALKKQQTKFENKMAEAEKLRAMDENQRREYEFEQKVAELALKEKEFAIAQNKLEATKIMSERGIPVQFVDYIVAEDADTMMENITTFERLFKSAVADAVAAKIPGNTPKSGAVTQTGMTREEFKKLSIFQKQELKNSNPELYKSLTSGV